MACHVEQRRSARGADSFVVWDGKICFQSIPYKVHPVSHSDRNSNRAVLSPTCAAAESVLNQSKLQVVAGFGQGSARHFENIRAIDVWRNPYIRCLLQLAQNFI